MPNPSVIDPAAIANLRSLNPGDGDEFLREITGIFLEDTPKRIAELGTSHAASDTGTFVRAAHSIKGSAANMGATALREVAEKLEKQSRDEGLADVVGLIGRIKTEFDQASAELKRLTGLA